MPAGEKRCYNPTVAAPDAERHPSKDEERMSISYNADEVFQIGMDVELNGKAFYEAAAAVCKEPDARAMMETLAGQEAKHYQVFSEMRQRLPAEAQPESVCDPDAQMQAYLQALADSRVFTSETQAADMAKNCGSAVDVLKIALQFEKDSVLLFQSMKALTRADWGQEKINGLIAAEQGHIRMISSMMATLKGEQA